MHLTVRRGIYYQSNEQGFNMHGYLFYSDKNYSYAFVIQLMEPKLFIFKM